LIKEGTVPGLILAQGLQLNGYAGLLHLAAQGRVGGLAGLGMRRERAHAPVTARGATTAAWLPMEDPGDRCGEDGGSRTTGTL
jgi:hypothetical protein